MLQDIKDEILSGEPLYTIRDSSGNVLNDNVDISLKTPIIQEGAPINRALFRNLQGDLYTQDRYSLTTITNEVRAGKFINNPIPTTGWIEDIANLKYHAHSTFLNGNVEIEATSVYNNYSVKNAFDGDKSTNWISRESALDSYVIITFPKPIKILKFRAMIGGSATWYLEGSDDNSTYTTLYTGYNWSTDFLEVEINPSKTYKYYRIRGSGGSSSSYWYVYEFEIKEWYGEGEKKVHNLQIPLTSYEEGKRICIKPSNDYTSYSYPYININGLGAKQINGDLFPEYNYSLIYNGESFDIANKYFTNSWTLLIPNQTTFTISNINKNVVLGEVFDIIMSDGANTNAFVQIEFNGTAVVTTRFSLGEFILFRCIVGANNSLYVVSFKKDSSSVLSINRIENFTKLTSIKLTATSSNQSYFLHPSLRVELLTRRSD